jgi:predicted nuclease of predicted toxin-antitoxin system
LKLLLDEMYPPALAEALRAVDIDATTVFELRLAGSSDHDIFAAAIEQGMTVLTENVADFMHISTEQLSAGQHHPGVLMALSSRFSRRSAGLGQLVGAIQAIAEQELEDRVIFLEKDEPRTA